MSLVMIGDSFIYSLRSYLESLAAGYGFCSLSVGLLSAYFPTSKLAENAVLPWAGLSAAKGLQPYPSLLSASRFDWRGDVLKASGYRVKGDHSCSSSLNVFACSKDLLVSGFSPYFLSCMGCFWPCSCLWLAYLTPGFANGSIGLTTAFFVSDCVFS